MKVLVVGGAGYIGSHMCHVLDEAGHDLVVLDNLSRGHRDAVERWPLLEVDIRDGSALQHALAGSDFDLAMHFAALAYVGESTVDPSPYYDNNVVGSLRLLDALRCAGIGRLVFSSTCATYGAPLERLITETHPQRPVNPYGWTKLLVERALCDYGRAYGFQSISLRYFNAAGADPAGRASERHDPETHLVPLALQEALRVSKGGNPETSCLEVYGLDFPTADGTCVRDYIHVNDLCAAHLLAAKRLMGGGCVGAEAYNLGNGNGFSVLEVIESVRRVTGVPIQYRAAPRRNGDPPCLVGSARHAHDVLGWGPRLTSLDEIIATAWQATLGEGSVQSPGEAA